jgi:hypothetical protein
LVSGRFRSAAVGQIKVRKTDKRIYKKRVLRRKLFGEVLPLAKSWTINNDLHRISWRVPDEEWKKWLAELNPSHPDSVPGPDAKISKRLTKPSCRG